MLLCNRGLTAPQRSIYTHRYLHTASGPSCHTRWSDFINSSIAACVHISPYYLLAVSCSPTSSHVPVIASRMNLSVDSSTGRPRGCFFVLSLIIRCGLSAVTIKTDLHLRRGWERCKVRNARDATEAFNNSNSSSLSSRGRVFSAASVTDNSKISCLSLDSSLKAKFNHAILVADRSEAGRRPAASWNLHELASLRQVCDQPWTCHSVMEFGFEPVCDQVRACSKSRHVEIVRTCITLSWSQTGSKPNFIATRIA